MATLSLEQRMKILAEASKYDTCSVSGICHTFGPDGRCIDLYKTLMSNSCSGECKYCPNQCSRRTTRASLSNDEIKRITWTLYKRNIIEGLFLSSGILGDSESTTQKQIELVQELRREGFRGYIHVRLMPGVPKDMLGHISLLADKFGVNVESTSPEHYGELCPNFDYKVDAIRRMRWTADFVRQERRKGHIVGANDTQFVVGADGETDWEYISKTYGFMDRYRLRRPYFMSFQPVKDTALEKEPSSPLWREHRLYQTSFLMKEYGYKPYEFKQVLDGGFLPDQDPKLMLAGDMMVDINSAPVTEMIRIPGIGPFSAQKITKLRPIKSFQQLKQIGVVLKRAAPFIEVNGVKQGRLDRWC